MTFILFLLQARSVGVAIGCILGMFPLLFMSEKDTECTHNVEQADKASGSD